MLCHKMGATKAVLNLGNSACIIYKRVCENQSFNQRRAQFHKINNSRKDSMFSQYAAVVKEKRKIFGYFRNTPFPTF